MSGSAEAAGTKEPPVSRGTLGVFIAWAARAQWRRALVLLLLCAALFLPGFFTLPPTDRDEARFAQASKQMAVSGDVVDIRYQEVARHKKPIGIYWAQAASAAVFGAEEAPIWVYRIPSVIGAILAVLLTAWATRPLVGARASVLAAAMMAGVILLSFEARAAKTDALLLAAIVAAQGALARLWFGVLDDPRERGWNIFYFWTALAVGVLVKGPIIFLPVMGALLWMTVYDRSFRGWGRLGFGWGIAWFLLLVAPWFIAIGVKTDGQFYIEAVFGDLLGKVGEGQESHGAPPGTYLVAFWGTFWPWTLLALIAIPRVWRWRGAPETAFLLGWLIPTWIIFEIVATKLPHYVLPTYPAIAALAAAAALDGSARTRGGLFYIAAIVWAVPSFGIPVGLALLANIDVAALPGVALNPAGLQWEPVVLAAVALLAFVFAWRYLRRGVWLGFARASLVGAGAVYASAYQFALPAVDPIWNSGRMAAIAEPIRACSAAAARPGAAEAAGRPALGPLGAVGYHEPSLVFLAGTDIALLRPAPAAQWLAETDGALVWVEARREAGFQDTLAAFDPPVDAVVVAQTTGFNYARGRWVDLTLYARRGDPYLSDCSEAVRGDAAAPRAPLSAEDGSSPAEE